MSTDELKIKFFDTFKENCFEIDRIGIFICIFFIFLSQMILLNDSNRFNYLSNTFLFIDIFLFSCCIACKYSAFILNKKYLLKIIQDEDITNINKYFKFIDIASHVFLYSGLIFYILS